MKNDPPEPCKHLRTGSTRAKNGYNRVCLDPECGCKWFEEDKPLTEDQEADRRRFEHAKQLG